MTKNAQLELLYRIDVALAPGRDTSDAEKVTLRAELRTWTDMLTRSRPCVVCQSPIQAQLALKDYQDAPYPLPSSKDE